MSNPAPTPQSSKSAPASPSDGKTAAQPIATAKSNTQKASQVKVKIANKNIIASTGDLNGYHRVEVVDPDQFNGHAQYGDGWCTDFAKAVAYLPSTTVWKPGPKVDDNTPKGTVIAAFIDGKYVNERGKGHVGLKLPDQNGEMGILDQFKESNGVHARYLKHGAQKKYNWNADNYFVVLVPDK